MQQEQHADLRLGSYMIEQGHRFAVLEGLLSSDLLSHYTRVSISIVMEALLYLLSVSGILAIISLPVLVESELPTLDPREQFALVAVSQIVIGVFTIPATALAFLLKRNRRKKMRIREAFNEVKRMREAHERLMGSLNIR